jgi:DNA repair protein RadC
MSSLMVAETADAAGRLTPEDEKLLRRGRAWPQRIAAARRRALWPLADRPAERSAAEMVRAWRAALPGLTGLRAWRFAGYLGLPVLVPEAPLRRALWRLGLLEQFPDSPGAPEAVQAVGEKMAALTGLTMPLTAVLLRWLTTRNGGLHGAVWSGGGWCAARPRCGECPFRPACAWARFHPAGTATPDSERRRPLEPIRRRIAENHQDQLQDVELLAALLQGGNSGCGGAFELAEALLRRFGGLNQLDRASAAQLAEVRGISQGRALQLKAALELGRRLASRSLQPGDPVSCSEDIWRAYRGRFRHMPQEHFVVVLMDAKNRVIHDHIVSKGSLTGSLAHPREVFQEAIRHAAAGIILLHNHPSGDPHPSGEDRAVTIRLREAGELLGIRVLDHIILGADGYYSFTDED